MRTARDISAQTRAACRTELVSHGGRRRGVGFSGPERGRGPARNCERQFQFCKSKLRRAAVAIHVAAEEISSPGDPMPERHRTPASRAIDQEVRCARGLSWKIETA